MGRYKLENTTINEVVRVQNVKKCFGSLEVIKDVSFSVKSGEVLGIIGPSGSGKSTMLRCIAQLEKVTDGHIQICSDDIVTYEYDKKGKKIQKYADKKKLRQIGLKVGLVFQNFNLFPHMNVLQNITTAQINVLKISKIDAENNAIELLKKMDLIDKAKSYPCELSGGQQQRVSIARSLALKPEVLCFDEPTSALDPELTGEMLQVIRQLAEENMTMIVVTHEMNFARDCADTVIFMDKGLIVEEGSAREVITNPKEDRTKAFLGKFF
ncbi:MAG: amino acid ABC transporter ATP-binding protein [Treponema sp.]|nr:amino acid ABC transporter ATP-binding protein [Treponema sp.]